MDIKYFNRNFLSINKFNCTKLYNILNSLKILNVIFHIKNRAIFVKLSKKVAVC